MLSTMGVLEMEKEFAEKMKQSLLNLKSEIIGQLMTQRDRKSVV